MGNATLMANLFNKRTPINVMLSVTNHCPSRCNYCRIPLRKQKELTTEQIFSLIDQLADAGTERVAFWGGEPLVRSDIGKIIDYAKNKGMFTTLDSNGYLLPQKIDELKNLDILILSIDGREEVHDQNREKGSHKKVIRALEIATKRIPVWTITVLTKNNLNEIDYLLDLAEKMGFYTTFQILHHTSSIAGDTQSMLPSPEEYREVIKKLIEAKKNGAPIVSTVKYLKHLLKWQDYAESYRVEKQKGDIPCWAGKLFCNVDTDGKVYPCVVLIEQMKALNFLDVGFKKAFDNLASLECSACTASCLIEFNLMFSLHLDVISNWYRYIRMSKNKNFNTANSIKYNESLS
jgi:MoaA/NifB/PqqE/SkfB family radical SAM enzyme